ncbi:MAG: hypothetical protein ACOZIN_08930 [Myxococcota bacterium]
MTRRSELKRKFEGKDVLGGLLELAGSDLSVEEVLLAFEDAKKAKLPASDVIPSFFDGEPRFADPSLAQRLFGNLLGLWDLVQSGGKVELDRAPRERPKKVKPTPPSPFGEAPSEEDVEAAWRYLEDVERLDKKEWNRLQHRFENVQDALLGFLDEQALSDEGDACARLLFFELFSMIELGWPPGCAAVTPAALAKEGGEAPPEALLSYADEAVFEAEHDEESPLSASEGQKVRDVVKRGLAALWNTRKPKR